MQTSASDDYLNLSSLRDIKNLSHKDSKSALEQVAAQFETIFMKMMMKSMRDASFGNPLFDSETEKFYREMHDDQLSLNLSKAGGMGIADTLVKQLGRYLPNENDKPVAQESIDKTNNDQQTANQAKNFTSAKDFVQTLWPSAKNAAEEIGVSPKLLLAQAALETGWGKYVIQGQNGKSSFNLFNIKADAGWTGAKTSISTVEFIGGQAQSQRADFRQYDSYEDSFKDYVSFLQKNPRYSDALKSTQDSAQFLQALQQAGYATDPEYANKIQGILSAKPLNEALKTIELTQDEVS